MKCAKIRVNPKQITLTLKLVAIFNEISSIKKYIGVSFGNVISDELHLFFYIDNKTNQHAKQSFDSIDILFNQ